MLTFLYRSASGEETVRTLISWNETDKYIQGPTADNPTPKTYLKSRILKFVSGDELLLGDSAPAAPEALRERQPTDLRPSILFTGFSAAERSQLEELAEQGGLRVAKSQIKQLSLLCCGFRAGPVKIAKAHTAGSIILNRDELEVLLDTGEMPGD